MTVSVQYWSWFRDIAGAKGEAFELPPGSTLGELVDLVHARHPRLADARRSTLVAVGVDYQAMSHVLQDGDQVSLFPPVQGG